MIQKTYEVAGDRAVKRDLQADPIEQLKHWWHDAKALNIPDFDAVNLSTVDTNNKPDSRMVLLKIISTKGLEFLRIITALKHDS